MKSNVEKAVIEKMVKINLNENQYILGRVTRIRAFILEVRGLDDVGYFEEVEIGEDSLGYVTAIHEKYVTVALLYENTPVKIGDKVIGTGREFSIEYSPDSFGNIIDIYGRNVLINKKFENTYRLKIERENVSIMDRNTVERPLLTGIAGIDLIYPIGKGQRQLIIGDKKTGKTQIGLDIIVNQRQEKMKCIYVAIGKTKKEVKEIYNELKKLGAMENTIILMASNSEKTPNLSLAPYAAVSIAEEYMYKGEDVVVILDDLKRHAEAYREISLLSGKVPGREAYPADIFYAHSRFLEKGCQHKNGGSISIIPLVETKGGDITDYISTNIISITDGQLVLSRKLFEQGQKPAINFGLSVSRLGGQVQKKEIKKVGTKVKRELLSYLETREVYALANEDEMSPEMREKLREGKKMLEKFNQRKFSPKSVETMLEMFATEE